jgi:hydroxypyruvate isomerase
MIKFSANLGMLFAEVPILERFQRAADAGFAVVEIWSPLDEGLAEAIDEAGVELLQFNLDMGDMQAGDRGLMCLPDKVERFRAGFELAIRYTKELGVERLNCLVGNRMAGFTHEEQLACMAENLQWLHPQLEANDLTLTIEPLSSFHSPNYMLTPPSKCFSFVRDGKLGRIKILYDIFHAQIDEGNLLTTMRQNLDLIEHIHIADAPDRHQPGTGEIDYGYLLPEIEAMGYDGYIGLEYAPLGTTEESLDWLPLDARIQARASDIKFG